MISSNNINIASRSVLSSPGAVRSELPLSLDAVVKVMEARQEICDILDGKSQKFLMIVGPCSLHDTGSAIEYAERLRQLSDQVKDHILLVMRAYFEKPRTTVGWKGLIYDPDLNKTYNIEKGIFIARKLMLRIVDIGLPVATEMLDPIIAQYIADIVSWAAIGARTTEAQTHRQLGSGLSMPVGFKNATDGTFQTAIDAISTALSEHSFIGVLVRQFVAAAAQEAGRRAFQQLNVHFVGKDRVQIDELAFQHTGDAVLHAVDVLGAAGLGGLVDACQAGVDDGSGTARLPDQYVFHGTPH